MTRTCWTRFSELVLGFVNKQVAGELGVSEVTIKVQRGQVMRKMQAQSLPALVRMVDQLGLSVGTKA
jgi:FixJ family two-component response regulator